MDFTMPNDQPLTLKEVIDEVHRLETINADLLAAVKNSLKLLGTADIRTNMLVTHLQAAVARAEGKP